MKNLIILIGLLFTQFDLLCQKKYEDLAKTKIGNVECTYSRAIDLDKGDTAKFIYMGFQNEKYSAISDRKSILLPVKENNEDIASFLKDLKIAAGEMEKKQNITWDRSLYSLYIYDFSKKLYLAEKKDRGDGYTTLSKKEVDKLILWFENLGFKAGQ